MKFSDSISMSSLSSTTISPYDATTPRLHFSEKLNGFA